MRIEPLIGRAVAIMQSQLALKFLSISSIHKVPIKADRGEPPSRKGRAVIEAWKPAEFTFYYQFAKTNSIFVNTLF